MQISHILVGKSEPIDAKSGRSGINKRPQTASVPVDIYGLQGDAIVDTENHGGRTQAVYMMGRRDYDFWEKTFGRKLLPGTFGENLIITDLSTHDLCQDDTLTLGEAVLKATYPRIPCVTLGVRMNDPTFPNQFSKNGHVGVYFSVENPGLLVRDTPVMHTQSGTKPILDMLPGYRA